MNAASSGLLGLASLLDPLIGTASAAAAIILVTLLVRCALIPVGISQARAEQTRARLAPRLRELQKRHGRDRERLQRETMKLYADEKASPLAGCLPLLIQAPVVGLIYTLFLHPAIAGQPNALLSHDLLGVPLGTSLAGAATHGALDATTGVVLGAIVLLIACVGEITRRMFRVSPPAGGEATTMLRMMGLLQYASAVAAVFVPLAAGLYLVVTVTWTLVQRIVLRRRFPLPPG
nr:YidC/Oxa1 family membrane protein insertase [Microbacterium ulmi]